MVRALNLGACCLLVLRSPPRPLTSPSSISSASAFFPCAMLVSAALMAALRRGGRSAMALASSDMATCRGTEAGGARA